MIDLSMLGLKAFEPHDRFSLEGMNNNFKAIAGYLEELTTNKWGGENRWRSYQWAIIQSEGSFGYSTGGVSDGCYNMQYADSYSLGNDGVLSLVDPVSVTNQSGCPPIGKYIKVQVVDWGSSGEWSGMMYVTEQVKQTSHSWTSDGGATVITDISISGLARMTTYERFSGMVESESADTFPADGWVGGTHYVKAPASTAFRPMVEYGSYVGTGTFGTNDPTALSFGIKPYLVYIRAATTSCDGLGDEYDHDVSQKMRLNSGLFLRGVTKTRLRHISGTSIGDYEAYRWDAEETLLSVWSDYALELRAEHVRLGGNMDANVQLTAADQLNQNGEIYYYIAIGLAE